MRRLFFLSCFHWMVLYGAQGPFADCLPADDSQTLSQESLGCIYATARSNGLWKEGAQHISHFFEKFPEDPWLPYYLGHFELKYDTGQAAKSFGDAASGFRSQGLKIETFKALDRAGLAFKRLDNLKEAARVDLELETLINEQQDDLLNAYFYHREAKNLLDQGKRLDLVLSLLADAASLVFPDGPEEIQLLILRDQYAVAWDLGLTGLVHRILTSFTKLAEEKGARSDLALAQYRWAILAILEIPTPEAQDAALTKAELAFELAQEDGGLHHQALTTMILGKLTRGEERRNYWRQSIEYAEKGKDYSTVSMVRALLAAELAETAPEEARQFLKQALLDNQKIENIREGVFGWEARMKARWHLMAPQEALESSLHELALIESLRGFQTQDLTQIQLFKVWSRAFFWLSGRLLHENQSDPSFEYLARAFQLAERVRARTLLETLDHEFEVADNPEQAMLQEVLDLQARNYWELAALSLKPEDEAAKLAELAVLTEQIRALRKRLDKPLMMGSYDLHFASLEEAQAGLAADEAILAFQLQPWKDFHGGFGGGSWLISVTRDEVRSYPLPEFYELVGKLELFLGLIENPDSFEQAQNVVSLIYDALFGQALANLSEDVHRLWLIPDKILYKVPFGVLRPQIDAPTMAEKYQLTTIPSATLWLKWRNQKSPMVSPAALSLSDPSLPTLALRSIPSSSRGSEAERPSLLGRLPYARLEGKALIDHLGGESRLLMGGEASEAFIKQTDLNQFGLLHFAAHALAGEEILRDSAVVLAPGDGEDGWLQPSEIIHLDLNGQVVVLSACQSASGAIYQGEGVMSLGRAFFQAGAHVVVGSLWKLRDDDAAYLFEAFYRHLAEGLSVSKAMQEAQLERMRAGAPVTSWSGVTVLGNGDLVPLPNGRPAQPGWYRLLLAGMLLALILGIFLAWRHGQHKNQLEVNTHD